MKPLVSVVVPVFNGERYLAECLVSIFAQDYRPIELIVVDDGSVDSTAAVAQAFADVRYVYQEHRGVSAARNTGIELAKGEIVSFFDHDDLMLPDKLSVQVGYLLGHPDVECVLARQEVIFEPGISPPQWLCRDPVYGDLDGIQSCSAVVRGSVFGKVGGFDSTYALGEDLEWIFRLRSAGVGIAVVPQVVMRRRFHGANASMQLRIGKALDACILRALRERVNEKRALSP